MIKQPSVENCLEMLGFNPYDTEYDFGVIRKFDKIKAKFVLDNFNNNNREINLGQRVNLRKNIELNMTDKNDMSTGWIKNGETMSFATDPDRGTNITEYQHRLEEIVYNDLIVPVPWATGVEERSFTKAAPAKSRTPLSELEREFKGGVTKIQESALSQLVKRRGLEYNIQTTVEHYKIYKTGVDSAVSDGTAFLKNAGKWKSWSNKFIAWIAAMDYIGKKDVALSLLKMLEDEVDNTKPTTTTAKDFIDKWCSWSGQWMSNTDRSNLVWCLLCRAADTLIKEPSGKLQIDLKQEKFNDKKYMKLKGAFRDIMFDPDNYLQQKTKLAK